MSKTKILLEGMGINPLEKIDNNCDSYWTLYELIEHCTEQLSIPRVVGQSEQLCCPSCKSDDTRKKGTNYYVCNVCGQTWAT